MVREEETEEVVDDRLYRSLGYVIEKAARTLYNAPWRVMTFSDQV
jgi:hypothetical protein